MPKYLIQGNYAAESAKGLLKDGGPKRVRAAKAAMKAVGGEVDAMYFVFGDTDVYAIVGAPDNASMTALSLAVAGTGALTEALSGPGPELPRGLAHGLGAAWLNCAVPPGP